MKASGLTSMVESLPAPVLGGCSELAGFSWGSTSGSASLGLLAQLPIDSEGICANGRCRDLGNLLYKRFPESFVFFLLEVEMKRQGKRWMEMAPNLKEKLMVKKSSRRIL